MNNEPRINEIIAKLEEEKSPSSLDLGVEEMKIFRVLALLRGAKGSGQVHPEFADGLKERLAKEMGIENGVSERPYRKGRWWLVSAITAAAMIAVAAGAFYLGRSSDGFRKLWPDKSTAKVAKEIGFGKLPVAGDSSGNIRSFLYAPSPAASSEFGPRDVPLESQSGPPSVSAPVVPGGSVTSALGWKVEYVWDAGSPSLPGKLKVYKNKPGSMDKRRAYDLAKKLGFTGPPRSITISHPDTPDEEYSYDYDSWPSKDVHSTLNVLSSSFSFTRGRDIRGRPDGDRSKEAPIGEKAIEIARAWLKDKGLLPAGPVEAKVQPAYPVASPGGATPSGPPKTSIPQNVWMSQPTSVNFISKLDGLPIYRDSSNFGASDRSEPLIRVEVGRDGEVTSAYGQFIDSLVSSEYPLRPVKEAFDEIEKYQSGVFMLPQTAIKIPDRERPEKLTIKSVELAYIKIFADAGSVFYEPIYVFKGTLEGINGRFEGTEVAVPAIKGEYLKRRSERPVPMPLGGASGGSPAPPETGKAESGTAVPQPFPQR